MSDEKEITIIGSWVNDPHEKAKIIKHLQLVRKRRRMRTACMTVFTAAAGAGLWLVAIGNLSVNSPDIWARYSAAGLGLICLSLLGWVKIL